MREAEPSDDVWTGNPQSSCAERKPIVPIVTDTTSGLTLEMAESLGVALIPQIVVVGDESYRDDTELDTVAFLEKLKTSIVLPKTAARPPSLYKPIFDEYQATGETVICLHPSAKVSGTVRSATVSKRDYPDADIRVIDTQLVAGPLGSVVHLAAQWARDGVDADTIVSRIEELSQRVRIFFVVDIGISSEGWADWSCQFARW